MSKDFYSDDHTIQTGAPGSGGGNLKLEGEDSVSILGKRSESYRGTIEVTDTVLLKGGEATGGGSFGEVRIQGADCIVGLGSLLTVGSNYVPVINENCDFKTFGNISGYTENGNPELYTENGTIKLRAINGELKVITPETTIDGNLTVTGTISGASTEGNGLSNAGDINITTTAGGDVNISATGTSIPLGSANITMSAVDITANATDEITLSAGGDIVISAEDDVTIISGTSGNGTITLKGGNDPGDPYLIIDESSDLVGAVAGSFNVTATSTFFGEVEITSEKSSGYIATITNSSTGNSADILKLELASITTPESTNNWIQFSANGSSKGSVQGADAATAYLAIYVPTEAYPLYFAVRDDGDPLTTDAGYVQYTSGNQDFGEWIPLGDESEWGIIEESKKEFLKSSIFPMQEGVVLYIRDSKVWKTGPGRGMVVTRRAVVIGNQNYKQDGNLGIIMSFTGQVPTFAEGTVEDGDLLVPVEGTNHCKAINPDVISFGDYRKAVGTAWGKKLTTEVGLVNCAIGIK
jgi:hypothetical protein